MSHGTLPGHGLLMTVEGPRIAPASMVPAAICTKCCSAIKRGKVPTLRAAASGRQE